MLTAVKFLTMETRTVRFSIGLMQGNSHVKFQPLHDSVHFPSLMFPNVLQVTKYGGNEKYL